MTSRTDSVITADELAERLDARVPVTVLDVRWQLDKPDGRKAYGAGHIPGAAYVDLESELSDRSITGRGRHPLPAGARLQAAARRWGARTGVPIVVYDNWNRAGSARAWWVLRAAGVTDVRILDGGLAAWTGIGRDLAQGNEQPMLGDLTVAYDNLYAGAANTVTADEAAGLTTAGVLIDARAPERFRGDSEPVDPVAGHIPGAVNVPYAGLLDEHGFFRPATELDAIFASAQVGDGRAVGAYCGSGVTAAVVIAALRITGIDAALFPGSWSQWSAEAGRPVAVAAPPD
ncbi:putative thiosulfate sulfurtransferase SseB [Nocardia cerradoensis]|uniref:Putative thiosulfate sulfurtransferase SseB n=1 Tax=Nocardia cerradoensis TaxID=85688 RepID=A0A231GUZ0_9NOCA|nr:sulfurtransferase [Nocardia cerradoensis]OXR40388.1 putative thiosulfate sulfurtransferase SseB [Nocardia cerradoensis]